MSLWRPLSFQPPWSEVGVHPCHCVLVEVEVSFQELALFLSHGFYRSNSNHQTQDIWQQATWPSGHLTGSSVAFSTCGILWDPECFRFQRIWVFFFLRNSYPRFILYFPQTVQLYIMILTFPNRINSSLIIGRMNLLCWWLNSKHVHKIPFSFCMHIYIKILETCQCFLSTMLYLKFFHKRSS